MDSIRQGLPAVSAFGEQLGLGRSRDHALRPRYRVHATYFRRIRSNNWGHEQVGRQDGRYLTTDAEDARISCYRCENGYSKETPPGRPLTTPSGEANEYTPIQQSDVPMSAKVA